MFKSPQAHHFLRMSAEGNQRAFDDLKGSKTDILSANQKRKINRNIDYKAQACSYAQQFYINLAAK
ncbi:MAG: hypothetical protein EAX81_03815 [Candidatus Thorarchaeota archaeon]|nr:hypothetical protein [Candidatus Thorarchaeota archaeon]